MGIPKGQHHFGAIPGSHCAVGQALDCKSGPSLPGCSCGFQCVLRARLSRSREAKVCNLYSWEMNELSLECILYRGAGSRPM